MSADLSRWDRLKAEGVDGTGYIRLRISEVSSCAAYIARRLEDGHEAIVLEVETATIPSEPVYPKSVGFSVTPQALTPGRNGKTRLILSLSDSHFRSVFLALGEDIIASLEDAADSRAAIRAFIGRLERWQAFLRKHGATGLSLFERRGLFGELLFLKERLLERCSGRSALSAWVGWKGMNQDFQFSNGSVEVKTTGSNTPHVFHVSNIRQLDSNCAVNLFLWLLMIEESEAGNVSLPELVESIRSAISDLERHTFDHALTEVGYLDEHRDLYTSPKYTVVTARMFEVREGFPCLNESLLPVGVEEVKYQVAVAACLPFECAEDEALESLELTVIDE